jgi:hypothetical protein
MINLAQSTGFMASVWFEVLLTAERYIAVCKPFSASEILSEARVRRAVTVVWVLSLVLSLPQCFDNLSFFSYHNFDSFTMSLFPRVIQSISSNMAYIITYRITLRLVVNWVVPFILLTFFTAKVLTALRKRYAEKSQLGLITDEQSKRMSRTQMRLTATLTSIIIIFLLAQIPALASLVRIPYCYFDGGKLVLRQLYYMSKDCNALHIIDYVNNVLLMFQSSMNFFVFCLTGNKYRQVIRDSFSCKKVR